MYTLGNLHEMQMQILRRLSLREQSSFSDLQKVCNLTSDHTNFHIKKLITHRMIEHVPKTYGLYQLTVRGKQFAHKISPEQPTIEAQAKISVVLWIKDSSGKLLRQRRSRHPHFGYWTRPTGKVKLGESILEAAKRILNEETGLTASLSVTGVEHKIDKDPNDDLLDDKYLFIVEGVYQRGELKNSTESAENYWLAEEEYASKTKRFARALDKQMEIESQTISFDEGTYVFDFNDY